MIIDNFIWDDEKNEHNIREHRISFAEARFVYDDPNYVELVSREIHRLRLWCDLGFTSTLKMNLLSYYGWLRDGSDRNPKRTGESWKSQV